MHRAFVFVIHAELKLSDELFVTHIREHVATTATCRIRVSLSDLRNHLRLSILENREWHIQKVLLRVEGLALLGRGLVEACSQNALLRVGRAVLGRVGPLLQEVVALSFLLTLVSLLLHLN